MTEVRVPCLCEGEPHPDGDTVTFRERIDFTLMAVARKHMAWVKVQQPDADVPEIMAALSEFYLTHCIERWTLVDERGKAVPVNKASVHQRLMEARPEVALELAEVADSLYSETVMLPLVRVVSGSSLTTLTNGQTSATNGSGKKRPKPSKRSSTTTTPMAVTGRTAI